MKEKRKERKKGEMKGKKKKEKWTVNQLRFGGEFFNASSNRYKNLSVSPFIPSHVHVSIRGASLEHVFHWWGRIDQSNSQQSYNPVTKNYAEL